MKKLQCILPIDNSLYAERDYLTEVEAKECILQAQEK